MFLGTRLVSDLGGILMKVMILVKENERITRY